MMRPLILHLLAIPAFAQTTVQTTEGLVTGTSSFGIDNFQGIPFAQPPVKDLRLRRPLRRTSSPNSKIDATKRPRACPQVMDSSPPPADEVANATQGNPLYSTADDTDEDCLTLTITRPSNVKADAKLPVLLWIHGGAYTSGSASQYSGESLVRRSVSMKAPMIYVAVQYRLGGLGFMPGKEVKAAGVANLGILDQRLGLEWVADNIAAFGGSPDKVTIWGESAGSGSVVQQLVLRGGDNTYKGKPVFRGAMMHSGAPQGDEAVDGPIGQGYYNAVVRAAGCQNTADTLQCLRQLDFQSFAKAQGVLPPLIGPKASNLSWRPRPDRISIPTSAYEAIRTGKYAKVPIISGNQQEEGTLPAVVAGDVSTTAKLIDYLAKNHFVNASPAFLKEYVDSYPEDPSAGAPFNTSILNQLYPGFKRVAALLGDSTQTWPRRLFMELTSAQQPTWSFTANYLSATPFLGTFHGTDIPFEFGQVPIGNPTDSHQRWIVSFVNELDPNKLLVGSLGYTKWPKWNENGGFQQMNIGLLFNNVVQDTYRRSSYEVAKRGFENLTN